MGAAASRGVIITAWVQHMIERWRAEGPEKLSFEKIAKKLGCSKPNAVNIYHSKTGVGPDVEASIADRMFNGSRDALFAEAKGWWDREGRTAPTPRGATTLRIPAEMISPTARAAMTGYPAELRPHLEYVAAATRGEYPPDFWKRTFDDLLAWYWSLEERKQLVKLRASARRK